MTRVERPTTKARPELGGGLPDLTFVQSMKFRAGDPFPFLIWPKVGGGTLSIADQSGWRMLVVYRGKHCPLCREYLGELDAMLDDFAKRKIAVAAVSADPLDKAEREARDERWRFPVAYDLRVDDMHELGLYISPPSGEAARPFAEPALFVVNPDGRTQVIAITNAPFSRPDLASLLHGLETAQDERAPIHGTTD